MSQAAIKAPDFAYAVGFDAALRSPDGSQVLFSLPCTIHVRGDKVERIGLPAYWRDLVSACQVPYEYAEEWLYGEVIRQAAAKGAL